MEKVMEKEVEKELKNEMNNRMNNRMNNEMKNEINIYKNNEIYVDNDKELEIVNEEKKLIYPFNYESDVHKNMNMSININNCKDDYNNILKEYVDNSCLAQKEENIFRPLFNLNKKDKVWKRFNIKNNIKTIIHNEEMKRIYQTINKNVFPIYNFNRYENFLINHLTYNFPKNDLFKLSYKVSMNNIRNLYIANKHINNNYDYMNKLYNQNIYTLKYQVANIDNDHHICKKGGGLDYINMNISKECKNRKDKTYLNKIFHYKKKKDARFFINDEIGSNDYMYDIKKKYSNDENNYKLNEKMNISMSNDEDMIPTLNSEHGNNFPSCQPNLLEKKKVLI